MNKRLSAACAAAVITAGLMAGSALGYFKGGWPETCLEMNDMVEASSLGSGAVGIYQRAFNDQYSAEVTCRRDHLQDVRGAFSWALDNPSAMKMGQGDSTQSLDLPTGKYRTVVSHDGPTLSRVAVLFYVVPYGHAVEHLQHDRTRNITTGEVDITTALGTTNLVVEAHPESKWAIYFERIGDQTKYTTSVRSYVPPSQRYPSCEAAHQAGVPYRFSVGQGFLAGHVPSETDQDGNSLVCEWYFE